MRPRGRGAYFVFELLWRGVRYGLIDTLLLTIFPCFVAYKPLHGHVDESDARGAVSSRASGGAGCPPPCSLGR
jgi:hypothetical protein